MCVCVVRLDLKLEQLLMRMSHDSPDSLIFMLNAKNRNCYYLISRKMPTNYYLSVFRCCCILFLCFFLYFFVDVVFFH